MLKHKLGFAITVMSLLLAGTASAQMGGMFRRPQLPRGLYNPVVGSGAQYEMTSANDRKMTMEYDVVAKDTIDGKDGFWFEAPISTPEMQGMIIKMFMTMDAGVPTITRTIMQMPGGPPMEMPQQPARMQNDDNKPFDVHKDVDDLGSESVTTPAGTFDTHHYRMKDGSGDAWISDKISPYGLVKYNGKGQSVILTKVITDAKTRITGTPVPFNPAMMGSMMGRGRQQ